MNWKLLHFKALKGRNLITGGKTSGNIAEYLNSGKLVGISHLEKPLNLHPQKKRINIAPLEYLHDLKPKHKPNLNLYLWIDY